jgi:glycosyltransferase involved in cell wall biosynthesis
MPKKVLFISHEADRSGAPIVLLRLLRWLKSHSGLQARVLLQRGGELRAEFEAVAPTLLATDSAGPGPAARFLSRLPLAGRLARHDVFKPLRERLGAEGIGLVYSNTVDNGSLSPLIEALNCPVVTHVHELDFIIRSYVGLGEFEKVRRHTTHYVAGSNVVADNLVNSHGIPRDAITVVREFVDCSAVDPEGHNADRALVRERLGVRPDTVVVLALASMEWRKGPDLFVQVARRLHKRRGLDGVAFVWVGGKESEPPLHECRHDLGRLGLDRYVHLLGPVPDPVPYFAASDVFLLTSREDPYPLVMLDAALFGNPVVCFASSGGGPEFVGDDSGVVVPYLDVEAMADAVGALVDDADLRRRLGRAGGQKVRAGNDVSVAGPQILSVIERFAR